MTDPQPSTPSAAPSPSPESATSVLLSLGITPESIQEALGGGGFGAGPLWGNDLLSALAGTSMEVSGRYGQTGQPYQGVLPPWARGLPQQVYESPDFDPYLGIVSQGGDERVYTGPQKQVTHTETTVPQLDEYGAPANKFATEMAGPVSRDKEVSYVDQTLTTTQAMNMPYTWTEDEVADAMKKLRAAGLQVDSFDTGQNSLVSAWGQLVNRAAMMYSLSEGKRKVTPWDVLDIYKKEASDSGLGPNRTETYVQRNVTDISEGEAFASLQSSLSQLLGRDPSDQETRDYAYRMNQLAASNPSVSRTVTRYKNGKQVGATTHTDPGFTSADMAQEAYDQAQNEPDYAEYRGASYLFNAAMSALGPLGGA